MKKKILFLTILIFLLYSFRLIAQEKTDFPKKLSGDQLYQEGLKLIEQEKYQEAVLYFEEATKRKPNFGEAHYQLGICYLKIKDFDKAKQNLIFAKILSQDETLKQEASSLLEKLPQEIEKEKKRQEEEEKKKIAKERELQTLKSSPQRLYNELSNAFFEINLTAAENFYQILIKEFPDHNYTGCATLLMAFLYLTEGKENIAEILYRECIEKYFYCQLDNGNKVGLIALLELGRILLHQGKKEEGEKLLLKLVKDYPNDFKSTRLAPMPKTEILPTSYLITPLINTPQGIKKESFIPGVTSYYVMPEKISKELPLIVRVGHPISVFYPANILEIFNKVKEECIVLFSGILSYDVLYFPDHDVANEKHFKFNSIRFKRLIEEVIKKLPVDKDRIYLTGLSYDAVYAWMLAYDQPNLYAGVVAMSSVSYPPQIQNKIQSAKDVVTVVVRGEKDHMFPRLLEQEKQTGALIEKLNPNSKWMLKQGHDHSSVYDAFWIESLDYIMQFKKKRQ